MVARLRVRINAEYFYIYEQEKKRDGNSCVTSEKIQNFPRAIFCDEFDGASRFFLTRQVFAQSCDDGSSKLSNLEFLPPLEYAIDDSFQVFSSPPSGWVHLGQYSQKV